LGLFGTGVDDGDGERILILLQLNTYNNAVLRNTNGCTNLLVICSDRFSNSNVAIYVLMLVFNLVEAEPTGGDHSGTGVMMKWRNLFLDPAAAWYWNTYTTYTFSANGANSANDVVSIAFATVTLTAPADLCIMLVFNLV
jgi:hypothetical protein